MTNPRSRRLRPLQPIWDPGVRRGTINVGNTPGAPPPTPLAPIVLYDTRNHDGSYPSDLVNEGSGGVMFDLPLVRFASGGDFYYYAEKRTNWYSGSDTGNGIDPAGWDDFGGTPNDAPLFFCAHMPPGFLASGGGGPFHEARLRVDRTDATGIELDAWSWPSADPGNGENLGGSSSFVIDSPSHSALIDHYPYSAGPDGAGLISTMNNCLTALYIDWANATMKHFWDDGVSVVSYEHTFIADDGFYHDSTHQWLYLVMNGVGDAWPTQSGGVQRLLFYVLGHDANLDGPLPGTGTPWASVTGYAFARPSTCDAAYVRRWWTHFAS